MNATRIGAPPAAVGLGFARRFTLPDARKRRHLWRWTPRRASWTNRRRGGRR